MQAGFRAAELPGSRPRLDLGRRGEYTDAKTTSGLGSDVMKFGIFYELQLPRPWADGRRAAALPERADAARDRRPARLRLRLGGGASLPRGIFALALAGILPRRRQPAHQEDPARPRHPPAHHQPSRARRRARRGARSALQRPLRIRHGRERLDHRADAVRPRHGNQARGVRGGGAGDLPDVHQGRHRASRQVFRHSLAQRGAEAGAEAASAAVDGLLAAADHRARRRRTALARSASSSSARMRRMPGCTPITTRSPSG